MNIHALHIGINNYRGTGSDLRGCVNDARDLAELFAFANSSVVLLDGKATRAGVLKALANMLGMLAAGDLGVITFSGHGTYVADVDGDEEDRRDEALVCADLKLVIDDELRGLLGRRHHQSRLFLVTDSCHSGTVHRFFGGGESRRVRYLPLGHVPGRSSAVRSRKPKKARALRNVIHFSGCRDLEYSYDAEFGGRANGAMTRALIDCLPAGQATFGQWFEALSGILPTAEYPQTPCVNASKAALKWVVPQTTVAAVAGR